MGKDSAIEWCMDTFNPWIGCTKVSRGCEKCYAETLMDKRYGKVRWGKGKPRLRTSESYWKQPLKWDRDAAKAGVRRRVFCASLADVFDEEVPNLWRLELMQLIMATPHLDWLLLTKRPKYAKYFWCECQDPPQNIWLGVSVEDQETADERIPVLLKTPAVVRFVSYEPALGPVDFRNGEWASACTRLEWLHDVAGFIDSRTGKGFPGQKCLDWIIIGGESGPHARPFDVRWARDTIAQCRAAGVACFVKQMGLNTVADNPDDIISITDLKGGDPSEWPEDLRIRAFPKPH